MQRSQLDSEIGTLLGDPSHDRWSTDVIHNRLEQAQVVVQALTNAVKTLETLTPVAGTSTVDVNANTIDIVRVTLADSDGNFQPINGRSRDDLDFYVPNWENLDPGQPTDFAYDASNHQLILVPAPDSGWANSNGLKVWEIRIPTAMTGDSSEPFDANAAMQAYVGSLIHWVVAECWMDDGTTEALAKSRFHKSGSIDQPGEFEKYVRLINAKFDSPIVIPERIKWMPQGGRRGRSRPSKAYPFA